MEMMTREQFEQLEEVRKKAQTDDTPYIGIVDGTINVNGDPNKTEIKPSDYTVHFVYPDNEDFRKRVEMTGDKVVSKDNNGWMLVERTYRNVYLTPRRMQDATTVGAVILQYLTKVSDDGETIKPLSFDEQIQVMRTYHKELRESAIELVATVLGINELDQEFLAPVDTVSVAFEISLQASDLVNGSDFFTEPLSGAKAGAR